MSHPQSNGTVSQALPLEGLRILELGNYIAAPSAGRLLADFGADVVKIERPRTGDEVRRWRLYRGDTSTLYRVINRNKRSIALDLRTEVGQEAFLALAAEADAILENFRPGTLEGWDLGPEALSQVNPDIIVTRVSAYGQTGPMSHQPGFGSVAEAFGGLRFLTGEEGRPPVRAGIALGDSLAGLYAAFATMMCLFQRSERQRRDGPTASVPLAARCPDIALYEAVFATMESLLPEFSAYNVEREPTGGRMEGVAPSNAYACSDGVYVIIGGNGNRIFERLMTAIGREDLRDDPALADNTYRWEQRESLDDAIGAWTARHRSDEVLDIMARASVPAGPIYRARDMLSDPHYASRGMIQTFDVDDGAGVLRDVAFPGITPLLGAGRSLPVRHLGPDLGADTVEVLMDYLGMERSEAEAFARRLGEA